MRGAGYQSDPLSHFMYGCNKENCWWYYKRSRHYLNVEEDINFNVTLVSLCYLGLYLFTEVLLIIDNERFLCNIINASFKCNGHFNHQS